MCSSFFFLGGAQFPEASPGTIYFTILGKIFAGFSGLSGCFPRIGRVFASDRVKFITI